MARKNFAALIVTTLCFLNTTALDAKPSTDRLVVALRKRNLATVMDELSVKGLDVNSPDSLRRLPLVEAVRSRDLRAVMALLEQGALARSHEPGSGITPLHLAFQFHLPHIARALLAHGADPNAKDRQGVAARSLYISSSSSSSRHRWNMLELLSMYDARGPMAFESEPGSWLKEERAGSTYFWNPDTGEARWTAPPSCAWRIVTVQGHPIKYVNSVTGQHLTSTPPALSWAKVRPTEGSELWLNWAVHVSSTALPAELPLDLATHLAALVNVRWYHTATGQYSYTDPAYSTAWRELKDEASARPYYFNVETGETVWEAPEELSWVRLELNSTEEQGIGQQYYYNSRSGKVSWTAPSGGPLAFVRATEL